MDTLTKYFGQVAYDGADVLHFQDGLFGFEEEQKFLLLPFGGENGMLLCLQSLKTPQLAFLVMNPFFLKPDYTPVLRDSELTLLGVENSKDLCYYVLSVVRQPIEKSTVNLKCPVVINADTKQAAQIILESTDYDMRHLLSEFSVKEAEQPC